VVYAARLKEEGRKGKTRDFFKRAKEITGEFTHRIGTMKSETGKTLTEKNEIKERWREYTCALYKKNPDIKEPFVLKEYSEEPQILESEIRRALHDISNNTSPGCDGIPIEIMKV